MAPLPDPRQTPLPTLLTGRNLAVVCLVFFVLFGAVVAGSLFPLAITSPLWQLRLSLALIHAAPMPLAALALLHLAAELDPEDPVLQRRRDRCARLAVAAVLGLLLLVPLQTVASLRQAQSSGNAQADRIQRAERKLAALRRAVANATGGGQLNRQLQELGGPVLSPADLAQPLDILRSQVSAALDEGEAQIARERLTTPAKDSLAFLPDLLRHGVACLAEAIGFAALAFRPGQPVSLLDEGHELWLTLRQGRLRRQRKRPLQETDMNYFESLSSGESAPADPQER